MEHDENNVCHRLNAIRLAIPSSKTITVIIDSLGVPQKEKNHFPTEHKTKQPVKLFDELTSELFELVSKGLNPDLSCHIKTTEIVTRTITNIKTLRI